MNDKIIDSLFDISLSENDSNIETTKVSEKNSLKQISRSNRI